MRHPCLPAERSALRVAGASLYLRKSRFGSITLPGAFITTDWFGSGSVSFTVDDLAAGNHVVALDINNTPSPGATYYLNETRNNGGAIGIYFSCPS
jgi:hypothetical protein